MAEDLLRQMKTVRITFDDQLRPSTPAAERRAVPRLLIYLGVIPDASPGPEQQPSESEHQSEPQVENQSEIVTAPRFPCRSAGCAKSFPTRADLEAHEERVHLDEELWDETSSSSSALLQNNDSLFATWVSREALALKAEGSFSLDSCSTLLVNEAQRCRKDGNDDEQSTVVLDSTTSSRDCKYPLQLFQQCRVRIKRENIDELVGSIRKKRRYSVVRRPCEVCGTLIASRAMNSHLKTHSAAKSRVPCDYCAKTFANFENQIKHTIKKHRAVKVRCPYRDCRVLLNQGALVHHVRSLHDKAVKIPQL